MQLEKVTYFKNLDGLRAIAAFAVVFAHLSYWFEFPKTTFYQTLNFFMAFNGEWGGRLGVIFFFILSGFLITYLMYVEQAKHEKVNLVYFYLRRILRIWPLYYLTLVIGFIVYPLCIQFAGGSHHENASWFLYVIFATNFDHIYNSFPSTNLLGVQWSVAVEEQFYLIWPIIFILFNKNTKFPFILLGLILLSELFYIKAGSRLNAGDYHFGSCLRYLSIGGLLGYICYNKTEQLLSILNKITKPIVVLIYVSCLTIMMFQNVITASFSSYKYIYDVVPALFFSFVIIEQNFSKNSFFKIGSVNWLSGLGKISYGIYLTHMIAINIVIAMFSKSEDYLLIKILLSVVITIIISKLSYTYIEKYFLSLKDKFSLSHTKKTL